MEIPPKLTAHLVKIEQAAHDISTGSISVDEFESLVLHLEAVFQRRLADVMGMDIPDDFQAELQEELTAGRHGIALFLDAMQDFRDYIATRQLGVLRAGVEKAREANELVNEAIRLNWSTYDTYRASVEEYAVQLGGIEPTHHP